MPNEPGGVISRMAAAKENWGASHCGFCGEPLQYPKDEVGEFYDPNEEDMTLIEMGLNHKIGHAQCGDSAGWELA